MNDERAREGVEHLQNAARELIAAARAFLDVAEEVVEDPSALGDLAATVSDLADMAAGRMRPRPAGDDPGPEGEPSPAEGPGRVQRIRLS